MAYVRRRGRQVAVVHGERDPDTGTAQQRVLFTFYTRAEAEEALGRGTPGGEARFRWRLAHDHPELRFDWESLSAGIAEHLELLPESFPHPLDTAAAQFREALVSFARSLAVAEPEVNVKGAAMLAPHRGALAYLASLLGAQLEALDRPPEAPSDEDQFVWCSPLQKGHPPPTAEARALAFLEAGERATGEAAVHLLLDAFPEWAEGWDHLGASALRHGDAQAATEHLARAVRTARLRFPRAAPKPRYAQDHAGRSYARALQRLAVAELASGAHALALESARRLEEECGELTAPATLRAIASLVSGRPAEALIAAEPARHDAPAATLVAALAAAQLGRLEEARRWIAAAPLPPSFAALLATPQPRRAKTPRRAPPRRVLDRAPPAGDPLTEHLPLLLGPHLAGPGAGARRALLALLAPA